MPNSEIFWPHLSSVTYTEPAEAPDTSSKENRATGIKRIIRIKKGKLSPSFMVEG